MKNLTPHNVALKVGDEMVIFEKSGEVARVSVTDVVIGNEWGVDIVVSEFGDVVGIPPAESGMKFLVSGMVLGALGAEYRGLAFAPDTGNTAVRNEAGHIVAVTRLKTV